jgi:hypothetical protein
MSTRRACFVVIHLLFIGISDVVIAQNPVVQNPATQNPVAQNPPGMSQHPNDFLRMTFFVTSRGIGNGGNLGGLSGADAHCQKLATAVGAGKKMWHAYLSTQALSNEPAVNARDRIGQGPWYNVKGIQIAKDLADLHGDTLDQARLGNNLAKHSALTEKGDVIPGEGDPLPHQHDMLTGSQPDGRAFTDTADHTCHNWTSNAVGTAQVGHSDREGNGNQSWNSKHPTTGCSQEQFEAKYGAGLFYCFAVD